MPDHRFPGGVTQLVAMSRVRKNTASTFRSEAGTYYFCCDVCGNCGTHHDHIKPAVEEAHAHLEEFHG